MAPSLKKHLAAVFAEAKTTSSHNSLTAKQVRALLIDRGVEWSDNEWRKSGSTKVKDGWGQLLHDDAEQSEEEREEPQESSQVEIIEPPSPVKKSKNKYERAAERNLSNFTQMVAGDLLGALGAGDDEEGSDLGSLIDDGEEQEDSESTAGHEEEEEEEAPAPKSSKGKGKATAKPKKRRSTSTAVSDDEGEDDASVSSSRASSSKPAKKRKKKDVKTAYKSAAIISDSDDEGPANLSRNNDEEDEGRSGAAKTKKPRKSGTKGSEKTKKVKKAPAPKEGDAPKGNEDEEGRITQLKTLTSAAGFARPFTAATGAERTLTASSRISHLESLLKSVGLRVGSGVGSSLPSLSKAKEVGDERALRKEMEDLNEGAVLKTGLRDGKKLKKRGGREVEDSEEDEEQKKKEVKKKPAFGAFLGDQGSSSD